MVRTLTRTAFLRFVHGRAIAKPATQENRDEAGSTKVSIIKFINLNPISMEQMHSLRTRENTILSFVVALLYFCAIMAFAYIFTMS